MSNRLGAAAGGALLAAVLFGCAGTSHNGGAARCDVRKVADVALSIERGYITVPALIEDKPVTMLVDTGSDATLVTPSAVQTLTLGRDQHARTTINGTNGSTTSQNAQLQSFGIGGMEMLDQSYAVAPLPSLTIQGYEAAGLIGADWLSQFDVDLDVPGRRMTLYRARGCDGDYPPWTGPRGAVVAYREGRGRVAVNATLDGTPVRALLDSGANRSTLSEAAAQRAGVTSAQLGRDRRGRTSGVDGNINEAHEHRFATLDVGTAATRDIVLVIAPLSRSTGADLLLGLDWLRGHEVWIDYRDRRVFIRTAGAAGG